MATNQLGSSPLVVCAEKFLWLLSQYGNTSSAVNVEGDGGIEYTQDKMKAWGRSNAGNQNDNSLFFIIIVESKENIEKQERLKNYRKQKW